MEQKKKEVTAWTQEEVDLLHEMVKEYGYAKWLRRTLMWWGAWFLGLPAAALTVWEPIVRLWKLIKSAFSG